MIKNQALGRTFENFPHFFHTAKIQQLHLGDVEKLFQKKSFPHFPKTVFKIILYLISRPLSSFPYFFHRKKCYFITQKSLCKSWCETCLKLSDLLFDLGNYKGELVIRREPFFDGLNGRHYGSMVSVEYFPDVRKRHFGNISH